MYLQKVVLKKFVGVLKVTDVNRRIRIRKSEVRFRGSGSVPKCYGSATLGICYTAKLCVSQEEDSVVEKWNTCSALRVCPSAFRRRWCSGMCTASQSHWRLWSQGHTCSFCLDIAYILLGIKITELNLLAKENGWTRRKFVLCIYVTLQCGKFEWKNWKKIKVK